MGRLRSRSRSPKRALISSRSHRHDYDYNRQHDDDSTLHQTYSYPVMDEGYDRVESRHILSRFLNAEERRGAFHHSLATTDYKVTSWKWSDRHDYYGYDIMGEGYHDQVESGAGGSELCRDHSCTSQLDPYQL